MNWLRQQLRNWLGIQELEDYVMPKSARLASHEGKRIEPPQEAVVTSTMQITTNPPPPETPPVVKGYDASI